MNFNYVSFESILIILHEINMIIVTHPTTFVHCFRVLFSGTHCKGVSKQLCVYHLYRNVFLAQTRFRYHLGCLNSFPNAFPNAFRNAFRNAFLELSRLSSISHIASTRNARNAFTAELHCAISSETQCI